MQHIAVITVVYNNYKDLEDYFASFRRQTEKDFHIFVVDNSPSPQEIEMPEFATCIRSENKGYAHGLNVGLDAALDQGYQKFIFMNSDTFVAKDFIEMTMQSIKDHPESLIGGKIYYAKGFEFHKDRYSKEDLGNVLWYAGGKMDWNHAFGNHRGVDEVDEGQYDKDERTEFVTGCFMAFDKRLIDKAGRMDDAYFLYYEDTDWSAQVERAGCKLMYDPKIVLWHKNAQSTGGSGSELHTRYQRRNRLRFGLRYAPWRTKLHLIKNYVMGK